MGKTLLSKQARPTLLLALFLIKKEIRKVYSVKKKGLNTMEMGTTIFNYVRSCVCVCFVDM